MEDKQGGTKTYHINEIGTANFHGDVVIYKNDKTIKKHLGTIPTFPDLFIGRSNEVEAIHQRLSQRQNILLLVNGQGGIGKTTLASKYYYHYKDYYQHLVWVFSDLSIVEALLTLALPLGVEFSPQADTATQLDILLQAMMQLNPPCLLVMDNANRLADIEQYHNRLLSCTNFHILLTTRVNKAIHNTELYEVGPLDKTEALQLFKKHYPEHDAAEDDLFFALFEKVDSNTLVVELLAKNLANFNDGLETEYTLHHLLQDLSTSLLQLSKSEKVATFYQSENGTFRNETPENIIAAMYDVSQLSAIEKHYLAIFSVLPAESIPYATLKDLAPHDGLSKILSALFHKGWLDYDKSGRSFRISPVVQEVIRTQQDKLYQDCEMFIRQLIDKLAYQPGLGHLKNSTYEAAEILARYAESIVANLKDLERSLAILCDRIGNYHQVTGNLNQALAFFEIETTLFKALNDSDSNNVGFKNNLAISYSKLGETHSALGNLNQALAFFEKFANLMEALSDSDPNNVGFKNDLAISYSKLGETNSALGNLNQALAFFKKLNDLFEALYDSNQNNVDFKNGLAISYCFLGNTHSSLDNLEIALKNYELYTKLQEELYKDFSSNVKMKNDLAISYEKLGETHSALGNLNQALAFFEKETTLFEALYDSYPNNVGFKNGLAISYGKLGETHSALGNLNKALAFFEKYNQLQKALYDSYPNNVGFKNGLAISYSKLGETHSALGDLNKALEFFGKSTNLIKALYDSYPNNVGFKNGLAFSYQWLGWFLENKKNDTQKAKANYDLSKALLTELTKAYPAYVEFQKNLNWVEAALKKLE